MLYKCYINCHRYNMYVSMLYLQDRGAGRWVPLSAVIKDLRGQPQAAERSQHLSGRFATLGAFAGVGPTLSVSTLLTTHASLPPGCPWPAMHSSRGLRATEPEPAPESVFFPNPKPKPECQHHAQPGQGVPVRMSAQCEEVSLEMLEIWQKRRAFVRRCDHLNYFPQLSPVLETIIF